MSLFFRKQLVTFIFYTTVFLTGAAVLIFEVAAVRMLAPYFGSSLYVLSSVLTTILAALSFGYYFGGKIADRYPHPTVLYSIIGSAGIIMLLLLLLSLSILPGANEIFSITTGPLVLSLTLFFIPAFLLGIDSPFVIKLLSSTVSSEHNGSVVGSTFFFSTFGSIFGSISAGFFFIPFLGLTLTILLVSVTLVIWSIGAVLVVSRIRIDATPLPKIIKKLSVPFLCVLGMFMASYLSYVIMQHTAEETTIETLYQKDGYYSNIHIFDRTIGTKTYRFLKNDVNSSSAIIPGSSQPVFSYTQFADLFVANNINVQNYLVLGGGSYTIPRFINHQYPGINIDVVEVEPSLFDLSHQYFELPNTAKITNHVEDARVFLQSTTTQYQVIFSDVMNSGLFIPPHLSTIEFFEAFKQRLAPDGIAIINFVGTLDTSDTTLTGSMYKTIANVFPNHKLLALRGRKQSQTQNMLFIVRHERQNITIPDTQITDALRGTITATSEMEVAEASLNQKDQVVFTDDKSLVEPLILKQFAQLKLK